MIEAKHVGLRGDGRDETRSLSKALDGPGAELRKCVRLEDGRSYRIGERVVIPSGTGLVASARSTLLADSSDFNNRSTLVSDRYGKNALLLNTMGTSEVRISGISLEFTPSRDAVVSGIAALRSSSLKMSDIAGRGLNIGVFLRINSCTDFSISRADFEDSVLDATFGPPHAQLTFIEIDNDPAPPIVSSGRLTQPSCRRLLCTPEFLAAFGYQTDGIVVLDGEGVVVANPSVDSVGNAIAIFARRTLVSNVTLTNVYNYAVKFDHGAQHNIVDGGTASYCGDAAVAVWGSESARTTDNNIVRNLTVSHVGELRMSGTRGIPDLNRPSSKNKFAAIINDVRRRQTANNNSISIKVQNSPSLTFVAYSGGTGVGNAITTYEDDSTRSLPTSSATVNRTTRINRASGAAARETQSSK